MKLGVGKNFQGVRAYENGRGILSYCGLSFSSNNIEKYDFKAILMPKMINNVQKIVLQNGLSSIQ